LNYYFENFMLLLKWVVMSSLLKESTNKNKQAYIFTMVISKIYCHNTVWELCSEECLPFV
jgi:hypothetical protein